MTPVQTLLAKLPGAKKCVGGWSARCPAHEDRKASLSVGDAGDGTALVKCHAGCTTAAVLEAVGLRLADLFPQAPTTPAPPVKPSSRSYPTADAAVADLERRLGPRSKLWTYHAATGDPVGLVVRWDGPGGKDIRPVRRQAGRWSVGAMPDPRPLYRLPDLAGAAVMVVTEGEPAADTAWSLGFTATTSAGGAQAAGLTDWRPLAGKDVLLLPDNDDPGRKFADQVAAILAGLSPPAVVRVVKLPGLPEKGDLVDWVEAHGDAAEPDGMRAEIEALARTVQPTGAEADTPPPSPPAPDWPDPPAPAAFHGLAGRFVQAIEPHTEADPVALLVSFLVAAGNALGRTVYFVADGSRHVANEFAVIVGQSSKARKGTSWNRVLAVVVRAATEWAENRVLSGLSSGEGLIYNVRDPVEGREPVRQRGQPTRYETVVTDEGVADKRLLLVESEFANVLKQTERTGNTLSTTLRDAWDGKKLSPLTKNSPIVATDPHVSIVGHITREELQRYLTATESANGFANRFLWALARRSKMLPLGGRPDEAEVEAVAGELAVALASAGGEREVPFDAAARGVWVAAYPTLSRDRYGLAGNLTGRAEAHVLRLALVYAALDCAPAICAVHLAAALAVWEYVERSVVCIFGDATGNPLADDLLRLLRAAGAAGMTRTAMQEATGRNLAANRIGQALGVLLSAGLARSEPRETGGRPSEVWFAVRSG